MPRHLNYKACIPVFYNAYRRLRCMYPSERGDDSQGYSKMYLDNQHRAGENGDFNTQWWFTKGGLVQCILHWTCISTYRFDLPDYHSDFGKRSIKHNVWLERLDKTGHDSITE